MSVSVSAAAPVSPTQLSAWGLGKYREIVIAVGFFLLFDLGVLLLNFYTSFQISQDAVGINLAGRQRMLTQRTAKSLLAYEASVQQHTVSDADLNELRAAVKLFDVSLRGFQHGATVPAGDGHPVYLEPAEGARAAAILAKAQTIWKPYQDLLDPVLAGEPRPDQLQEAVNYAKANNVKLLSIMNELTTALEAVASDRASTLRLVQTGGIVLAMLNFVFILFKFVRRLRKSDDAVEAVNEENREILSSVREGLFLITPDFRLGQQMSQATQLLFGRTLYPGEDFFAVLAPLVSGKDLEAAHGYVELLFQPHVKESLVQSINPLSEVGVMVKSRLGQESQHYLSFQFNRAKVGTAVRHLLVTVQDVTERVHLTEKLEQDRERARNEFAMLLAAFATDPTMLRQFVARSEEGLLEVNDLLRSTSSAVNEAAVLKSLDNAARRVHALKGDASMLGLNSLAELAHQFESGLQSVRDTGGSMNQLGNALLGLPSLLENLLSKIGALKHMARTTAPSPVPASQSSEASAPGGAQSINQAVERLLHQVAKEQGKQVFAQVRLGSLLDLEPQEQHLVREIAVQLARNAVTHGIELPQQRQAAGKAAEGRVEVGIEHNSEGWMLRVHDDGQGLSADKVRQRLLNLGWYSAEQLASFSERQIIEQIFKPGFSTAGELSMHAGRGAGLDVVVSNVQRLGAHMRLTSTPSQFTEFRIHVAD